MESNKYKFPNLIGIPLIHIPQKTTFKIKQYKFVTYIHTYIKLHYITLHYIALHYITLHICANYYSIIPKPELRSCSVFSGIPFLFHQGVINRRSLLVELHNPIPKQNKTTIHIPSRLSLHLNLPNLPNHIFFRKFLPPNPPIQTNHPSKSKHQPL